MIFLILIFFRLSPLLCFLAGQTQRDLKLNRRKSGYNTYLNLGKPVCFCTDIWIHISHHEEETFSHSWKASWGAEKWTGLFPNCPRVETAFRYLWWTPGAPLFWVPAQASSLQGHTQSVSEWKLSLPCWESPPPCKAVAEKQLLLVKILAWVKQSTPGLPTLRWVSSLKGQRMVLRRSHFKSGQGKGSPGWASCLATWFLASFRSPFRYLSKVKHQEEDRRARLFSCYCLRAPWGKMQICIFTGKGRAWTGVQEYPAKCKTDAFFFSNIKNIAHMTKCGAEATRELDL